MESTRYYTGIGSRRTPENVLKAMRSLASILGSRGFTLRSGAADGADTAFEQGAIDCGGTCEIWLPWPGFNQRKYEGLYPERHHFEMASTLHPAWQYLKRAPQSLHARNTGQVLGQDLDTPSEFVVCYTPDGAETEQEVTKDTGGTGTAIRLASRQGIPVFNLARGQARLDELKAMLRT